jgi:hypothetical protein
LEHPDADTKRLIEDKANEIMDAAGPIARKSPLEVDLIPFKQAQV